MVRMALPWGLLIFVIGIAYGWLSPGRENKGGMLKRGLLWGIGIAIVLAILGFVFGLNPLGVADNGLLWNVIAAFVLTIAFVIGVWIGDMLPGGKRVAGPRTGMRRV